MRDVVATIEEAAETIRRRSGSSCHMAMQENSLHSDVVVVVRVHCLPREGASMHLTGA